MAGVPGLEPGKWRDQNPLPYHLATPQFLAGTKGFEPLQNDLESFVLPLHQVPKILKILNGAGLTRIELGLDKSFN